MTFITNSITNANPGPALYSAIETAALALGWTLDDTVTIGGNTHKVLKSAAAGNTYGLDWYLDINYPTTGVTGGMRFAPFEGYTAASDVGLRGPVGHVSNTTIDATTYSRYGASTSALETNWHNSSSATGVSVTLTTSAFTYWISVTRDRIIVLTNNQATTLFYTGFFTPTSTHSSHAGAALFPLVMAALPVSSAATTNTSGSATLAFTRVPKATSINWSSSGRISTDPTLGGYFGSGQVGTAVSEITGAAQIVPVPVVMGASVAPSAASSPLPASVGYLDGVAIGYVSSSAVRGDTVTVGSDTWYATTPSSSYGLFFKGA